MASFHRLKGNFSLEILFFFFFTFLPIFPIDSLAFFLIDFRNSTD